MASLALEEPCCLYKLSNDLLVDGFEDEKDLYSVHENELLLG